MAKKKADDAGQAEVQQIVDRQNEQGVVGVKVDPTPDAAYTVGGVIAGAPTPETDPQAAAAAEQAAGLTTEEATR